MVSDVVAFLGFLASFSLFASPAFIFRRIITEASVVGYPFLPYPMAFLNCMIWLFYGTVHTNSDYVIIINSVGMIIEVIFMGFYIWFADGMDLRVALIELFGMGGLGTFVALLGYLWRDTVFGYAGVVSGIIMYGSPLSVARRVFETRNVQNMSLLMALASLTASSVWTAYAFASKPYDFYIAIPNLIGLVLALVQLALYAYYYFNGEEEDVVA
ncbi:hypothetical protein BDA96_03G042100 [Sorghum bicolor]|uniref:Sugar transporter SWEET1 n=2 Tax=Sorghum bicolor TaxID=4558 RepID=A0A921RAB0_SORBI|nr:bidirectional sugar transporter SWEET7b [Sorghum bicolor]EES00162.1 hypothetical protein SORBI_3003G038700 [Sorghum bicolor]KAG0536177.1 hypothetical protein BDA96_03G042100 [Sorghum bicolor]|eukprot:XP_002455042.1 bidirectional sugar transporter SWEET7b [Sorghum bicolor]